MRRALIVAFVGAMLIAPPAAAADPEPPNTSMNDHGPNVPVWQTFEIFGTAGSSPIDHFECRLDDGPWETCTSPWDPALSGGDHAIGARAVDINGLADPTPATAAFFVDVDGPSVSVLLNEGAATTGRLVVGLDLAFDDRASVGDILISNSPELDGEGLLANAASAWVVGPPTWRLDTFGGTDHAGPHTVYVQAKDTFGNWSDPASDTIVFDPALDSTVTIRLAVSQNPAPIGGEIKLFGIGHADDGAGIHDGVMILWVDGTSLSNSDVSWSIENGTWIDASGLAPGTYVLRATFEDSADLEDASASLTFKVGPALALLGPQAYFSSPQPPHDPWDPAPFTLPVYSRHASAVAFQCRVDGGSWSSCTNGLSVAVLPDGWHLAEVRGIDSAGRVQAVPETFLWFVRPTGGDFEVMPVGGYAPEPNVHLLFTPPAGALALRVSNSRAVDPPGPALRRGRGGAHRRRDPDGVEPHGCRRGRHAGRRQQDRGRPVEARGRHVVDAEPQGHPPRSVGARALDPGREGQRLRRRGRAARRGDGERAGRHRRRRRPG